MRARAYAQQLAFLNKSEFEVVGLFFGFDFRQCEAPVLNNETKSYFEGENLFIPNLSDSLQITFKENNWHYIEVNNVNVNSDDVLIELKRFDSDIIVFAGYGGQILWSGHFITGRKYLHMHPGSLPEEKGSTTIYYSILNKKKCSVTAFCMTEKIDDGENILCEEYPVPFKGVDIDRWFDNIIRADCFKKAILLIKSGKPTKEKPTISSEEYYVIHPVLKHVALLSLKADSKS